MNYTEGERRGRRPGESGTRQAIAEAARRLFGERGYERTTLRAIAAEAGVDAALVAHFFGSKQQLYVTVVELPVDPAQVAALVMAGDPDAVGERFARFVVGLLEHPESRSRVTGIVRAAAPSPRPRGSCASS
jgi:AcrR family transcriptional regulator